MISQPIRLEGQYFDGNQPIAVRAVLAFEGQEAILTVSQISERYFSQRLSVSPRIGGADRFINLPNGAQVQCSHHVILDSLPQESLSEGPVAWLEERWGVALIGVAIIAAILLVGYFYGLPAAAKHVTSRIPIKTEQTLGRQALDWLDNNKWFKPTTLEKDKQERIRNGFDVLRSDLPFKDRYRLEFRDSTFMGPNAMALPGGTIVITDDMVKAAESQEEVLAILAHEIGHVELRHSLRSILQNSAVAVVAATVTSDAASLSIAVAGLPVLLAQTKYSREFETEADDYAFKLLKKRNYSPAAFASIMERLAEKQEGKKRSLSFISTHPVTEDRVKRARAAAQQ
ncbi:MAG: M48 family metallopeptidase [Thermodesulfovibrionales bacterium]|jgi:Zn-dependent protease with chaperone function